MSDEIPNTALIASATAITIAILIVWAGPIAWAIARLAS